MASYTLSNTILAAPLPTPLTTPIPIDTTTSLSSSTSSTSSIPTLEHTETAAVFIFDVITTSDNATIATSLSNQEISLWNPSTLQPISRFTAHSSRIHDIQAAKTQPNILTSCAADGVACIWDVRTNNGPVLSIQRPGAGAAHGVSLGCGDTLMATASKDGVHFFDIRSGDGKILGEYKDSHSDDVLCVQFHASKPTLLMTGGADGLACVFDVAVNGEDEALVTVCNAQSDVVKIKVLDNNDLLCCQTTIEDLHLFTISDGQQVGNFSDFRATVKATCGLATDYVVDTYYNTQENQVHALVGSFSGDLLDVGLLGDNSIVPCGTMTGGHYRPVRCAMWGSNGCVLTGGEDTKLCLWNVSGSGSGSGTRVGGGSSGRIKKSRAKKNTPY